jgi:hypothetical protein
MEAATSRLCVAMLMERQPASVADPFWPIVHGEERVGLPALLELLVLLAARDRPFEVRLTERPPRTFPDVEAMESMVRRQLWIEPGGSKDERFVAALRERTVHLEDGVGIAGQRPMIVGLVSWHPS